MRAQGWARNREWWVDMDVFSKTRGPVGARLWICFGWLIAVITLCATAPLAANAQDTVAVALRAAPQPPLVIRNDRGGRVGVRAKEVAALRSSGRRVELRGRVCLSSCTMYLGLKGTCVEPSTVFGFHGPSYYGRALSKRDFEHWSHVIAAHYPAQLSAWYLRDGRHRRSGYHRIKGQTLIGMGIARCR